eukprot:TRINITY_DN48066_c0_g1_i1.p1 TRINITY_DN48066_c0_g1~~TRINITY_DN48066_c0_g1_i1.p1  ORF type:complete len:375 (-),score=58.11 TRINITY_DN48066_c0_g1_i1:42-1166(-)
MGESHAYGTSLFCMSRRLFILGFCMVMTALVYLQIWLWFMKWHLFGSAEHVGTDVGIAKSCTGTQCFEVFSCFGEKDTTYHVREPLATLSGAIFYPIGVLAAYYRCGKQMKWFGVYMLVQSLTNAALLLGDAMFLSTCNAYSTNVMSFLLSTWQPPTPLRPAAEDALQRLDYYPVQAVSNITQGFNVMLWYYAFAGVFALLVLYVCVEAMRLCEVLEWGPLGLGAHFGIDQWDEALNHSAIRRHKMKEIRSKFIDDANAQLIDEVESGFGKAAGYGAIAGATAALIKAQQQYDDEQDDYRSFDSTILAPSSRGFYKTSANASMTGILRAHQQQQFPEVDEFHAVQEEEAEKVRALAERLADEESPEAILDRALS